MIVKTNKMVGQRRTFNAFLDSGLRRNDVPIRHAGLRSGIQNITNWIALTIHFVPGLRRNDVAVRHAGLRSGIRNIMNWIALTIHFVPSLRRNDVFARHAGLRSGIQNMRFIAVLLITILGSLPNSNSYADTIYSWTDKNGVKKFSNTAPEEDVEHFEVIEEMPLLQIGNTNSEAGEEELGDVTQEPEIENRTSVFSTIENQVQPQETENNNIDEELNSKIQTEKKRLQEEIDRIDKLAVGKNFSLPRKNSMMKDLQDKLELLEKSPEKYFGVSEAK